MTWSRWSYLPGLLCRWRRVWAVVFGRPVGEVFLSRRPSWNRIPPNLWRNTVELSNTFLAQPTKYFLDVPKVDTWSSVMSLFLIAITTRSTTTRRIHNGLEAVTHSCKSDFLAFLEASPSPKDHPPSASAKTVVALFDDKQKGWVMMIHSEFTLDPFFSSILGCRKGRVLGIFTDLGKHFVDHSDKQVE